MDAVSVLHHKTHITTAEIKVVTGTTVRLAETNSFRALFKTDENFIIKVR